MPFKKIINYEMCAFPVEQTLYTESEMALALNLTVKQLHQEIFDGNLCYHFIERNVDTMEREYFFQESAFEANVAKKKMGSIWGDVNKLLKVQV